MLCMSEYINANSILRQPLKIPHAFPTSPINSNRYLVHTNLRAIASWKSNFSNWSLYARLALQTYITCTYCMYCRSLMPNSNHRCDKTPRFQFELRPIHTEWGTDPSRADTHVCAVHIMNTQCRSMNNVNSHLSIMLSLHQCVNRVGNSRRGGNGGVVKWCPRIMNHWQQSYLPCHIKST